MSYSEPLRIMGLDEWLQNALGVNTIFANVLCCFIIFLGFFLPMYLLHTDNYVLVIASVLIMGFLTSVGWLPFYTWIIMAIYIAYNVADKMRGGF